MAAIILIPYKFLLTLYSLVNYVYIVVPRV